MRKCRKTYNPSGVNGEKQPLPPLWTKHIDSGASSIWWDATGKVIRNEDEKGALGLSAYGDKNVAGSVIYENKNISTKHIKKIETKYILQHKQRYGKIPHGNPGHKKYGPLDKKPK